MKDFFGITDESWMDLTESELPPAVVIGTKSLKHLKAPHSHGYEYTS